MTKHTPGPWDVAENGGNLAVVDATGWEVAWLNEWNVEFHPGHGDDPNVDRNNARLIAAAPDLLGVLVHIEHWHEQCGAPCWERARAVIRAATEGGS